MKEFLVFVFFCFILPVIFDTYKRYEYKFCRQQRQQSFKECKNWLCRKTGECEFSRYCGRKVYDKPVHSSLEVCRKRHCRHRKECQFYVDNWHWNSEIEAYKDEIYTLQQKAGFYQELCNECMKKCTESGFYDAVDCEDCDYRKAIAELREQAQDVFQRMHEAHSDSSSGAVEDK